MNPDDLREWLIRQPFRPFRIHLSDGREYDILNPEFVLLLRTRLQVGLASEDPNQAIPVRTEDLALQHIVSLEELVLEPAPADAPPHA